MGLSPERHLCTTAGHFVLDYLLNRKPVQILQNGRYAVALLLLPIVAILAILAADFGTFRSR